MTRALGSVTSLVKASPFALFAVVGLWVIGITSNAIIHGPTLSLLSKANLGLPALNLHGTWYPLASRIWCADLTGYLVTTVLFLLLCAPAERILGSRRTASIFLCALLSTTALTVIIAIISTRFGIRGMAGLSTASAVGPLTGAFGVFLAATYLLSPMWRRRIRTLVIVTLSTLVLYSGQLQDMTRLIAAFIGLVAGPLLLKGLASAGSGRTPSSPNEPQESRFLAAIVVVAVAAGPFIMPITRAVSSPGSRLLSLWMAPSSTRAVVHHLCRSVVAGTCNPIFTYVPARHFGAEVRMILPVLIACVLAAGLWRGYHSAYVGALAFYLLLAAGGTFASLSQAPGSSGRWGGRFEPSRSIGYLLVDLIPAGVALLIFLMRHHFTVRSPLATYRRLWQVTIGALVITSSAYLVGGFLMRSHFDRAVGFVDLVRNLPSRFLPPTYLGLIRPRFRPVPGAAGELSDWTGVAFWIVVLVVLVATFRRGGVLEHCSDPNKIRQLLREHGGSTLAYMSTWEGHDHWVSPDGRNVIAYRVVSGVAIATGEPLGDPARKAVALREFTQFCGENGWAPCLFCISEDFLPIIEAQHWQALKVANDVVIPLASFSLSGRRMQDARTAINRARRDGISAEWIDFHDAPESLVQQIELMSRNFAAARGTPQLSFTIGGVSELLDAETRALVAIDSLGVVHGVVSWIPVFKAGEIMGWTLDFMRRSPDGMKGVMDYLIASSALSFQEEGFELMSLSGVPLPPEMLEGSRSIVDATLKRAGSRLDRVFRFESLLEFKGKYRPRYDPLFVAYRDGMDLPRIAYAIGRAYLPKVSLPEAIGLSRSLLFPRRPLHSAAS